MRITPVLLLLIIACQSDRSHPPGEALSSQPPNIVFLIADDWSHPHAGTYGDAVVRTPTFDFLADNGALFHNAYCAAPSCSPSRAALLTARYPHQLESAGNLWSVIPNKFPNWVSILESAGYFTGSQEKGWGPGDFKRGGYLHNPAGKNYPNFETFLSARPQDKPFFYWFGSTDPHRSYETNSGVKTGMSLDDVTVPQFMPDLACIRNDILDYYYEVERFDRQCGNLLRMLEQTGELSNTIVVMTSDNGMPFPRAKANLYDYGTRMPLAIYWEPGIPAGRVINDFINSIDLGPSLLQAAGVPVPGEMAGRSILGLLQGNADNADRSHVFLERERHANVRQGNLSYPMRAVRNDSYLYIRNFFPDRYPGGDPQTHQSVGQYGDVDNSISKFLIMEMEGQDNDPNYFSLSFGKRPQEELYHVLEDPFQLHNLAGQPAYHKIQTELNSRLQQWMTDSADPRATDPETIYWDTVEYTPHYQFENFDLEQAIDNYQMLRYHGYANFDTLSCKITF